MKAAVESIKAPNRASGPLRENDISDFEDERQDDPWQGTQLQRFMTTSPKKTLTGLTGLQGVTSYTRAAAGYSKPEKRPSQPTRPFESARTDVGSSKTVTVAHAASDSSSDTDDDDLDAPSRIPSRPPPRVPSRPPTTAAKATLIPAAQTPSHGVPKAKPPPPPSAKPPQNPLLNTTPRTAPTQPPPSSKPSMKPIPPHPSPPIIHEATTEARPSVSEVRQRLQARRQREENAKRRAAGSGTGVDEIPVFLV